ncbi:MAG: hypothetical protein ICV53_22465, partial [Flavisolibacter sp.]|nr:hypothetical protein [Flavisolibacter sp.]
MKISWFFFPYLLFVCGTTVAQINETFSDSDFTNNPTWTGTPSAWIVNNKRQLQSNHQIENSTFYLSTANTMAIATQWEFFVRLHFNTSSVNYVDAWLTASAPDLSLAGSTGYFVRIGNTEDEISLYRKNANGSVTRLIDGINGVTNKSDNVLKIKVIRTANNQFILLRDVTGTGESYALEGSATDATYTTSAYFGFLVRQSTASFFGKHYWDDIVVQSFIPDVTPPAIRSVGVISANKLDILFSEPVSISSEQVRNYSVNNSIGNPSIAQRDSNNSALVHLSFATAFPNGASNIITISGVQDLFGNTLNNGTSLFSFYIPQKLDVVINEILFNPKPDAYDYVELYNRSNYLVDISQLSIA